MEKERIQMKKQSTAVNVITAIIAAFLSVTLVVMCIIIPVYMSLTALVKPKQLVAMVQNIDYAQMVTENEGVQDAIEEFGIPADVVNELISSKAMGEVIGLYASDVSAMLEGKEVKGSLTVDALKSIVNDNIDEIIDIVKTAVGEDVDSNIDVEEIKKGITDAVNDYAEDIVSALPDVNELKVSFVESEGAAVITAILSSTVKIILIAFAVVLAGLIYLCRFRNFNALLWLGIDFGAAGIFLAAIAVFMGSGIVNALITDLASINESVVNSVLSVYNGGIITALVIMLVLCALLITGYVLLKIYVLNKKQELPVTQAAVPEALPESTEAVAEEENGEQAE